MTPDKTVPGGGLPLGGMSADDGPASHQSASPRNKAEVGDRAGAQSQTKGVLRSVQAKRPFSTNEYSGINRIAAIGSIVFVIGTTTGLAPERNTDQPFKWSPTAAVTTDGRTDSATTPGQHLNAETETRTHVEVMLDSMLITQRVPAGVAFEQRIGEVNDPRILEVMRDIDNTLGGRIEWPNVYVSDDLTAETGNRGVYRTRKASQGETVPPEANEGLAPNDRFGITIDKGLVDREYESGWPQGISVRSLVFGVNYFGRSRCLI